jgi:eukaryotic-like serine/threonine-protein kinase
MNSARQEPRLYSSRVNGGGLSEPASLKEELPSSSIIGRLLSNRYVSEALSREGPFSVCYRANDTNIGQTVCLELLPRRAIKSFGQIRRAVTKLAALGDPNIVDVIGLGLAGGAWPFVVTELAPSTLREALRDGPFELARVVRLGAQLAGALAAAHGAGVLHGALALDRVAVFGSGSLEVAKLSGFGIARVFDGAAKTLFEGTPEARHVAPERLAGAPLDVRSDVYSLGAILYELVTGTPPSGAGVVEPFEPRPPAEPPSRRCGSSELSFRAFDKIIERCLMRAPEQRYPNAAELAIDLGRLDAALGRAAAARARVVRDDPADREPRSSKGSRRTDSDRPSRVELSPARRPPQKSVIGMRKLPKVIVQAS